MHARESSERFNQEPVRKWNGICIDKANTAQSLMRSFARGSIDEAYVWRAKA